MLNRSLTLTDLTLFGVASIMGSGGFNLIGHGVKSGGNLWPWALGISAVLLMGSAFTYVEAFERFRKNTSESDMIRSVLGPVAEGLGATAILVYNVVSIVVILVFCSKMLIPSGSWLSQISLTIALLAVMTGFALLGIDVNKDVINKTTWGLVGVLVVGVLMGFGGILTQPSRDLGAPSKGGFMNSLWMFFFVLVGFDALMKFSEESKDAADIPASFYLSNIVSIVLTAGVAMAIAVWLPGLRVGQEDMALELLFGKLAGSWIVEPFKWAAVFFLLLTTFVVFLSTTRYMYGLGEKSEWLAPLRDINAAKAPWVSIVGVGGIGAVLGLLNNMEILVMVTDMGFAVIAALVAGSVSIASWRDGHVPAAAISGATGVGFLGLIASAFLL